MELNVCAEFLQHIRTRPGCEGAVWFGLTQRQERERGLDELICNAPGLALMLQFKSPWANSRVDYLYRFSINRKQHRALENLAIQYPTSVYYVFPLYSKWAKVNRNAPSLATDTWLIPVSCISLDASYSRSNMSIVLQRNKTKVTATGSFLEVTCEAINAKTLLLERNMNQAADLGFFGVSSVMLREWVEQRDNLGLRFRGLNALYLPD